MAVSKQRKKKRPIKKTTAISTQDKLSSTIMEFVQPVLFAHDNIDMIKKLVGFGILVWNLSFFPLEGREEHKQHIIESIASDDQQGQAAFNEIFNNLLERKDTIFGNDKRFVTDYKINANGRLTLKWVDSGAL